MISVLTLILAGFSLAIIKSVAPSLFLTQLVFYLIGFCVYFLFSKVDCQIFKPFYLPIYLVSCILLLAVFVLGVESRGAVRWLEIAGFRLQLSEILKPFFLLSLASFLTEYRPVKIRNVVKLILFCLLPAVLVLKQPDLGSAIIYLIAFAGMIFMARVPITYLLSSLVAFVFGLPVVWNFLHHYQRNRILSFLNPAADPRGASYNAIQAEIAIGSGMVWGKGLGYGTQSQLLFLPEKHTDFVFASLMEELGLIGGSVVLVVYGLIIFRLLKTVSQGDDAFENLYLLGVLFMFFAQAFINIGMNVGLTPVTGITLPFISYGGSSLLSWMILFGLAEGIVKQRENIVKLNC